MDKVKILFLAADPSDATRLRLGQELRDIRENLQLSKQRDGFSLESRESVRPRDITQSILDVEPQIIHFSGHGLSTGELCFENVSGKVQPVQPEALANLFELVANQINCVVLNACYSETQAKAIAKHIPFVIGMTQAIGDKAAIAFAVGFYKAMGAGRSLRDAYKFACVEIQLEGIAEHLTPILYAQENAPDCAIVGSRQIQLPESYTSPQISASRTHSPSNLAVQAMQIAPSITIQEFVSNQSTLAEQFAFFAQQVGLVNPRQDYSRSQFEAYCNAWKSLQALRLAGDDLWEEASDSNLVKFAEQLRSTLQIVREGEIFFEELDRQDLFQILEEFENFRIGKRHLVEIRSQKDLVKFSRQGSIPPQPYLQQEITRQIERNRQYKIAYEKVLDRIRQSFNKKLSR
jgi:CHAT domain